MDNLNITFEDTNTLTVPCKRIEGTVSDMVNLISSMGYYAKVIIEATPDGGVCLRLERLPPMKVYYTTTIDDSPKPEKEKWYEKLWAKRWNPFAKNS